MKKIVIKGAKEHNLKNVSLEIPKDKFVVITGLLQKVKEGMLRVYPLMQDNF